MYLYQYLVLAINLDTKIRQSIVRAAKRVSSSEKEKVWLAGLVGRGDDSLTGGKG